MVQQLKGLPCLCPQTFEIVLPSGLPILCVPRRFLTGKALLSYPLGIAGRSCCTCPRICAKSKFQNTSRSLDKFAVCNKHPSIPALFFQMWLSKPPCQGILSAVGLSEPYPTWSISYLYCQEFFGWTPVQFQEVLDRLHSQHARQIY